MTSAASRASSIHQQARVQRPAKDGDGVSLAHEQAIGGAARVWAAACARQSALSPRQAAEEAYVPGGPSVDELEERIRRRREQAAAPAA
jgi:hypothetical protein